VKQANPALVQKMKKGKLCLCCLDARLNQNTGLVRHCLQKTVGSG